MKRKSLILSSALVFLLMPALAGCGSKKSSVGGTKSIVLWVGGESAAFYKSKVEQYLSANPDAGLKVDVVPSDIGSAGGAMDKDNTTCGDIVSIAHDNIGKLSQKSLIAPIVDDDLLEQIETDNPEGFKEVIVNTLGNPEKNPEKYVFAAPYISQALFLYYDTRYVSDEQAETFEGLEAAARAHGEKTKSVLVTGTDGFNFSFSVLARKLLDGGKNEATSRIYEGFDRQACYEQSNDQVAVMRWLQRSHESSNGILLKPGSSWEISIQEHNALAAIGGAWQYEAFKSAVGAENIGCKPIPTFKLTDADVKGLTDVTYPNADYIKPELRGKTDYAPKAGQEYRGGSFVDCKCFVINMAAVQKFDEPEEREDVYYKMTKLIKYLSSVEVQKESFVSALNVPAFVGADKYINELPAGTVEASAIKMAQAQTAMAEYGIAQPFVDGRLNTFYYQNGGPDAYVQCIMNNDPDSFYQSRSTEENPLSPEQEIRGIRRALFKLEYIWRNGKKPNIDGISANLPSASDKQ